MTRGMASAVPSSASPCRRATPDGDRHQHRIRPLPSWRSPLMRASRSSPTCRPSPASTSTTTAGWPPHTCRSTRTRHCPTHRKNERKPYLPDSARRSSSSAVAKTALSPPCGRIVPCGTSRQWRPEARPTPSVVETHTSFSEPAAQNHGPGRARVGGPFGADTAGCRQRVP